MSLTQTQSNILDQIQTQQLKDPHSPTFKLVVLTIFDFIKNNLSSEQKTSWLQICQDDSSFSEKIDFARQHIPDFDNKINQVIKKELTQLKDNALSP